MYKLHGVRLIKGIKIFESMLKTKSIVTLNTTTESKFHYESKQCKLSLFYLARKIR